MTDAARANLNHRFRSLSSPVRKAIVEEALEWHAERTAALRARIEELEDFVRDYARAHPATDGVRARAILAAPEAKL